MDGSMVTADAQGAMVYSVTSLKRNCLLLGPYGKTMPRVLQSEVPL